MTDNIYSTLESLLELRDHFELLTKCDENINPNIDKNQARKDLNALTQAIISVVAFQNTRKKIQDLRDRFNHVDKDYYDGFINAISNVEEIMETEVQLSQIGVIRNGLSFEGKRRIVEEAMKQSGQEDVFVYVPDATEK